MFWVRNDEQALRTEIGGESKVITVPREVGDGLSYVGLHFANENTGIALIRDMDGKTAHVLTFDSASHAWIERHQIVDQDVIASLPLPHWAYWDYPRLPHVSTAAVRSWADGSWVIAVAASDAQFTHRLWTVSSSAGAAPVERWTPILTNGQPLFEPAAKMIVNVVGLMSSSEISAVAYSLEGHEPAQVAFVKVDAQTGDAQVQKLEGVTGFVRSTGFEGTNDYYLSEMVPVGEQKAVATRRYCRAAVCTDSLPLYATSVANFPWATTDLPLGPVPNLKLVDLRGATPVVHEVKLPSRSSELEFHSLLPDPSNPSWLRIVAYDRDVDHLGHEYLVKPESGEVTELSGEQRLKSTFSCLADETQGGGSWCFRTGDWRLELGPKAFFFTR